MVPRLRYDVIRSICEAFLNDHNPAQSARVAREYLARLPRGTSRGPEPTSIEPRVQRDDGPSLAANYEVGNDGSSFASKGVAVRLDARPEGISRGWTWVVYDHDTTMRLAAAWSGESSIDWNFPSTGDSTRKLSRKPPQQPTNSLEAR